MNPLHSARSGVSGSGGGGATPDIDVIESTVHVIASGSSTPRNEGLAAAAAAAGDAAPLNTRKVTIYSARSGVIPTDGTADAVREFQTQAANDLAMIKSLVLQKMDADKGLIDPSDVNDYVIYLNMGSGEIVMMHSESSEKTFIDMSSATGANTPGSLVEQINHKIQSMQAFLVNNDMMESTTIYVVEKDFDIKFISYVGSPRGENGFARLAKKIDPTAAAAIKEMGEDDLDAFFGEEEVNLRKAVLYTKHYKKAVNEKMERLEKKLADAKITAQDRVAVEKKLGELGEWKDSNLLFLVCALRASFDGIVQEGKAKEAIYYQKAESFFRSHPSFGDGKERLSGVYKQYAALITAAALYGDGDKGLTGHLEYERENKRLYRHFLESKGIDPNTNLGLLEELLQEAGLPDIDDSGSDSDSSRSSRSRIGSLSSDDFESIESGSDTSTESSSSEEEDGERNRGLQSRSKERVFRKSAERTRAVVGRVLSDSEDSDSEDELETDYDAARRVFAEASSQRALPFAAGNASTVGVGDSKLAFASPEVEKAYLEILSRFKNESGGDTSDDESEAVSTTPSVRRIRRLRSRASSSSEGEEKVGGIDSLDQARFLAQHELPRPVHTNETLFKDQATIGLRGSNY